MKRKEYMTVSTNRCMDRRTYLGSVGAVVAATTVAGCTGGESDTDDGGDDDETEYGVLSTSITDQPNDIDHFESLDVTIQGVWIKPADAEDDEAEDDDTVETEDEETENGDTEDDEEDEETQDDEEDTNADQSSGRYYIEFEDPQTADLVELQGDNTQLIDEAEVEVGDYQFLQLDVSEADGTLKDSDEEPVVETPGNAPLQFQEAFEIRAEETTRFIADFAPFQTGQGKYIIRPVASGTRVLYGDEEYTADEDENGEGGDSDGTDSEDESDDAAGNGN